MEEQELAAAIQTAESALHTGKPFQKLSALPTAGESSIGIGLFIVKKVLELHCGELKVLNRPEGGARFELLWPATSTC